MRPRTGNRSAASRARRSPHWRPTLGRATSESWSTPSSARWCSRAAKRSTWTICRSPFAPGAPRAMPAWPAPSRVVPSRCRSGRRWKRSSCASSARRCVRRRETRTSPRSCSASPRAPSIASSIGRRTKQRWRPVTNCHGGNARRCHLVARPPSNRSERRIPARLRWHGACCSARYGARPPAILVGVRRRRSVARRVSCRAHREHHRRRRHRAEARPGAAGWSHAAVRRPAAACGARRRQGGEAVRRPAAEAASARRRDDADAARRLEPRARPLVAARHADRNRHRRSREVLALPDHQPGRERDAGLCHRREVPGRADLRDREGARADRQCRRQRVHRQQPRRAAQPGSDPDRPAGRPGTGAGRRRRGRPAALREPVRGGAERDQQRAHQPLRPRHQGEDRALVQERSGERVQAVLHRARFALRQDRRAERRRDPAHQRLRDEQPGQGAGDLPEAARREPHRDRARAPRRDLAQDVLHRMTRENFVHPLRWAFLLPLAATLVAAPPSRAQQQPPPQPPPELPPPQQQPPQQQQPPPPPQTPPPRRPVPIVPPRTPPANQPAPAQPGATRATQPPPSAPVDKKEIHNQARTVVMSFDKRDLTEVIQFVSQFTQRNFILPERVAGKITILSNSPIPAEDVWNVFVAALDANNWAVYPVGKYWKLVEKKQSARANIPIYLERGQEAPPTEQMVTKLFKLRYVEADQMRNVLNQFTSRDSDFQLFPPDTLVISDLGLNMRRLEKLVAQLDQPGGSEEIHIVPVQYAGAQELVQKLTEIFQAQPPRPPV